MSTIASPRETSVLPLRRLPSSTPTSSGRPSLENTRSGITSPEQTSSALPPLPPLPPSTSKRANRAALREFYKLRAPRIAIGGSEVPASDLDDPEFDAGDYVARVVENSGLEDVLRLYTQVVGELRALDAEKKALVYDNYSKLITATETIRKLRANMDPLNPMASTLDPAIAQIYSQASSIREKLRESVPPPDSDQGRARAAELRRQRSRHLAAEALATPNRLRHLVREGKVQEAKRQWEMPKRLLVAWLERGIGGADVQAVIDEGDAVFQPKSARVQANSPESSSQDPPSNG
ncbi:hypothetical protein E4U22_004741 [Claviceps purpurea]|nr:hypothetical protein E4U38_007001 [Claviceps purpurea]KAG6149474.1 hypothetical protein E4U37_006801 [Claviceps purpurea]KAG6166441.1 hypothetical protein E4U11_008167 [Claviceps purpurea]KAG6171237.1 hypothetical protein E4U51_000171 [Claviceps purpurea]KAG6202982.1 hypothetical protein E4U50_005949 [Claviceps purpurea]